MSGSIVMIHGMWGGPWCWEKYRSVFEPAGYRCQAPVLPYHDVAPDSPPDPRLGRISLLDYADALEREISGLAGQPILMGHSMGGLLAQMLAARGRARALVLLTTAAPAGILALRPSVARAFCSIQMTCCYWKKPVRQTYAEAAESILNLLPETERKENFGRFVFESGRAVAEIGQWWFDPRGAARVDAAKVTCPVLVVGASLDRITPASVVRRVARRYRHVSTYKEFENHAHWVIGEPGWEEVAAYVLKWLEAQERMAALPSA